MTLSRMLCVFLGFLASCEALEPCPTGDDLSAWELRTNIAVARVDLPVDRCRRQPELRAELGPSGRISLTREFTLTARSNVLLSAQSRQATATPCFWPSLRVDTATLPADSADFALDAGRHVAEVAAEVPATPNPSPTCVAYLRPQLDLPNH